jgi:GNAT superfamily N-acetyltransferase
MSIRIERLAAHHERKNFDCGETPLNEFLRKQAGQQQRRGFGKTYVALAENGIDVIGFVTVSAGQVASLTLPQPPTLPRSPAPILRMGRLAVDRRRQGQGIGQDLLSFVLHIALEFSEAVGLYAIVVDAKNETVSRFYRQLGFVATLDNPLCLFLPIASIVKAGVG